MTSKRYFGVAAAASVVAALICCSPAPALQEHVFSTSFGAPGSGDGQFEEPMGVAASAATHDVYVVDRGNERVERFSSTGTYLSQFDGSETPSKAFLLPEALAVDNSSPPSASAGDVYMLDAGNKVIDKFSAAGLYISQLTGTPTGTFGELEGVAVDGKGDLWVYERNIEEGEGRVDEFSDTGTFMAEFGTGRGTEPGLAVNAVGDRAYVITGEGVVSKYSTVTGAEVAKQSTAEGRLAGGVAVDLSSGHIFVDSVVEGASGIEDYQPFDENEETPPPEPFFTPIQTFTGEEFAESHGIAADPASGNVYASEREADKVEIFTPVVVPDVTTGAGSGSGTSATMTGSVNPDGEAVTACEFEYGTSTEYGATVPCVQSPAEIGSGMGAVPVSAEVSGLEPRTVYYFRLVAADKNGANHGHDGTFTTVTPALVEEESVAEVSATGATLQARLNPGGVVTTYSFEYGTSTDYGQRLPVPEASLGAGLAGEPVSVHPANLEAGTAYHYRVVATSSLGTVYGEDEVFTTQATGASAFSLPDGRAYEMVSPVEKDDGAVPGEAGGGFESALDGDAFAYTAPRPFAGAETGAAEGQFYLASRSEASGWSTEPLLPPQGPGCDLCEPNVELYSSELTKATLHDGGGAGFGQDDPPLVSGEPAANPNLFVRDNADGAYQLVDETPPGVKAANAEVEGASADLSHVIFQEAAPLTVGAQGATGARNLYEWDEGTVRLVSFEPSETPVAEAELGYRNHTLHAVSEDGERVFFTAPASAGGTGLYVREGHAHTVQLDASKRGGSGGGGEFMTASANGAVALFTDTPEAELTEDTQPGSGANLYEFDVESGALTDLTAAGDAEVQGVLGTGEDGSHVYFVAKGVLTGSEANAHGEAASEGEDNLYLYRAGAAKPIAFIGRLAPEDSLDWNAEGGSHSGYTARVTPDGEYLAFESIREPTGYDNRVSGGGSCGPAQSDAPNTMLGEACTEVFEYDAGSNTLVCASCDPSGARPSGPGVIGQAQKGEEQVRNYLTRNLSENGRRLFFDTPDALVAGDDNGEEDVYEYEQDGEGSCQAAAGCRYLISTGTSSEGSYFLDADATGANVFFSTAQPLVAQDDDTQFDVYDARIGGGFPAPPAPPVPCDGEECRPASPPAPPPPTTATVTFSGPGNAEPVASIGKLDVLKKTVEGTTVKVAATTPASGSITAFGYGFSTLRRSATRAGSYTLLVRLSAAEKRLLQRRRKVKLTLTIRYLPATGAASSVVLHLNVKVKA